MKSSILSTCLSLFTSILISFSLTGQTPFITTWKTDNPGTSNSTSITIPTYSGETYLYDVDWDNDGVYDQLGITGSVTHNYGVVDTVTIRIQGLFPRIYFNNGGDRKKLLSIDQWGTNPWTSMENAFMGCWNMHIPALDNPDLSGVTSMARMFQRCDVMNEDIGDWDVSQVTDMTDLFYLAFVFNQDISAWNVSGVTSMDQMFTEANAFNQPIGSWDVSNVTNMVNMFHSATSFDQDLSNWDVSHVTNMGAMFSGVTLSVENYDTLLVSWASQSLQNAVNFDGGNSQYCNGVFARQGIINNFNWTISDGGGAPNCDLLDYFITTWKTDNPGTSNSTSIKIPTFAGETYLYDVDWDNDGVFDQFGITGDVTHDYGSPDTVTIRIQGTFPRIYFNGGGDKDKILSVDQWGTISWVSMNRAFQGCTNLSIPASDAPDLSNVTNMSFMFQGATSFNSPVDSWDVSSVTNMGSLFQDATSFNRPVGSWDVSSVTNMLRIFSGASSFNQPLNSWDVSNVTVIWSSFQNATSFNQPLSNWDVSHVPTLQFMFSGASSFDQDISSWIFPNVTSLSGMFSGATSFNQDISGWDVSNVTNMTNMFSGATSFDQNLAGWDMEGVTSVSGMFTGATLSQANYDSLLIHWSQQNLTNNLTFNGGNSQYCAGAVGRHHMIDQFGWTISDGGIACSLSDDFVTTWQTDNPGTSNSTSITIPTTGSGYYYDVDWDNDGVFDTLGVTGDITHDFGTPGVVTIRIRGAFPRIFFLYSGDAEKLLTVDQWGSNHWATMEHAFAGCTSLQVTATDVPDLSGVTSLGAMFALCTTFNSDISAWDVSHVTSMVEMFLGSGFNQNIENWDISSVENMTYMFSENAVFNQPLDAWDVSGATDMSYMFSGAAAFNQPLSAWDVSNVQNMQGMFYGAEVFNQPLDNWDVSNVTDMAFMFYGAEVFDQPLDSWDVSNVLDMYGMFSNTLAFNQPLSGWDVSNVIGMISMFSGAASFNQDISAWDVSHVLFMGGMFSNNPVFNQPIGNWNTSQVIFMSGMFQGAIAFNNDLSAWDVHNVEFMQQMFEDATAFDQPLDNWDVSNVLDMSDMFHGATSFNQPFDSWNVSNVMDMRRMFQGATSFDQSLGDWNVSNVAYMDGMFTGVTLSTSNYDSLLIAWNALPLQNGVSFDGGLSQYCAGTAARNHMINVYGWTISDGGSACMSATDFVTTWKTDNPGTSGATSITIPTFPGETYAYDIDWDNDGVFDTTGVDGSITHDFGVPGIVTIRISGQFPRIYFNNDGDRSKLLSIDQWGTQQWTSMEFAFAGCDSMTLNAVDFPDLSGVTSMRAMLASTISFNSDISTWDVSSVTDMSGLFSGSAFNQNIESWDVSNVTSMVCMFCDNDVFNQPLNNWDVSSVTNFDNFFSSNSGFNYPLDQWDVSNATSMAAMFINQASFNQDISGWDVSQVTDMSLMFTNAASFNQDISGWDVGQVTNMYAMFSHAASFNQDISGWDVSQVTDMSFMFSGAAAFNQAIGDWQVDSVINMREMFADATAFDQNIGSWDVRNVTNMTDMFSGVTLSTEHYDSLLIGWATLPLQMNVSFSAGNSYYCAGDTARQQIIDDFGWTITDSGRLCDTWWTGNMNTDWFDEDNWTNGVPVAGQMAFIPDVGANPYPVINTTGAVCKILEAQPGTSVTIQFGGVLTVGIQ